MGMPNTLLEAVRHFADPVNCREYMVLQRWPDGIRCPQCGSKSVYFDQSRNGWECKTRHPKRKFTLKTGTIFEDSPLGLDKWLPTVWMIANCKNGVSSWEIHRAIGVTQKTAWFMLHRIRLAMQDAEDGGKLGGEVEVDETYIGGKGRFMHESKRKRIGIKHGRSTAGKTVVMGLLERHGDEGHSRVRTQVLSTIRKGIIYMTPVQSGDSLSAGRTMKSGDRLFDVVAAPAQIANRIRAGALSGQQVRRVPVLQLMQNGAQASSELVNFTGPAIPRRRR